jgi:ribose 5-phosphate isomerase B
MKAQVLEVIRGLGHEVEDLGTHTPDPVDFPDIARAVCDSVAKGAAERGMLVCGTGVGASIAANKRRGTRFDATEDHRRRVAKLAEFEKEV